MPFVVKLQPDIMAMAMVTAEERPKHVAKHIPSVDPDADLIGALTEFAWAWKYRLPYQEVNHTYPYGDGGIDFLMKQGSVDLKSSARYNSSWVVKAGKLRSDWYVFAHVVLPDTVIFKGKATREVIERFPVMEKVGGNRLIHLSEIDDIDEEDFSRAESE